MSVAGDMAAVPTSDTLARALGLRVRVDLYAVYVSMNCPDYTCDSL